MKQQKTRVVRKKQKSAVQQPAKEVVVEQIRTTRVPVVEIRRPATLAQALTEPKTAVIKPKTTVVRNVIRRAG